MKPSTTRFQVGLEPGEVATWRLSPNMFSPWGTVDVPAGAVLTVEAIRLDGADGEPLFDASQWDDGELERLRALEAEWTE